MTRSRHRATTSAEDGGTSAEEFCRLLEEHLREWGLVGVISVEETQTAGLFLVSVEIEAGPGLLFETADWVDRVRILDPDGEAVTVSAALRYVQLRAQGLKPSLALASATAPRHRRRRAVLS